MEIGLAIARKVNYYFTNSQISLSFYIRNGQSNCFLLPFATELIGEKPSRMEKKFDIVVAGGMRSDRIPIVNMLTDAGYSVACFGRSWSQDAVPDAIISDSVTGHLYTSAIRSGYIYLSFSRTAAGYENLKIGLLDAAAQGACVLTHEFEEISNFFEIGSEILTYSDEENLLEVVKTSLSNPKLTLEIGEKAQARISREHLWLHRWASFFKCLDINSINTGGI
jgi:spore maturation protein CgeB